MSGLPGKKLIDFLRHISGSVPGLVPILPWDPVNLPTYLTFKLNYTTANLPHLEFSHYHFEPNTILLHGRKFSLGFLVVFLIGIRFVNTYFHCPDISGRRACMFCCVQLGKSRGCGFWCFRLAFQSISNHEVTASLQRPEDTLAN